MRGGRRGGAEGLTEAGEDSWSTRLHSAAASLLYLTRITRTKRRGREEMKGFQEAYQDYERTASGKGREEKEA